MFFKKILCSLYLRGCSKVLLATRFQISIVRRCDFKSVLDMMTETFLRDDPLAKSLRIRRTESTIQFFHEMWTRYLEYGISLKIEPTDLPGTIAGAVINSECHKFDSNELATMAKRCNNYEVKQMLTVWCIIDNESKARFNLDNPRNFEIGYAATAKEYRGVGIATKLFEQSIQLARYLGYKTISVDCTSAYSAKIAENLGMTKVWETPYGKILDLKMRPVAIPEKPHTSIKVYSLNLDKS